MNPLTHKTMKNSSKEADTIQEQPEFAEKFANTVFMCGVLYSALVVFFAVYKIYYPLDPVKTKFYSICILFGILAAVLFGFGLRLSKDLKVNLSLLLIVASISVYGIETYLALQRGIRTPLEVIKEFNEIGVEVYPNIHPGHFIETNGLSIKNRKIFPLGGISNITSIIGANIFESDEHGFNNSKGLYKKNRVDIMLTGDSFTQGYDVQANETISAVLRKLDFTTISIGMNGNGPLREYAVIKEYSEPLTPKIVLWLYFANDIPDLENELNSSFLGRYLNEEGFTQNLISRQDEIDSVLINYYHEQLEERQKNPILSQKTIENHWLIKILKLYYLRNRINIIPPLKDRPEPILKQEVGIAFKNILEKSNKMVSGWGGRLYFVYLPSFYRYSTGKEFYLSRLDHNFREYVLRTATELDIPVIDIHMEVFAPHPDPLSLFPFRMNGHYNADGYRLVAEALGKRLEADGFIPFKSNN